MSEDGGKLCGFFEPDISSGIINNFDDIGGEVSGEEPVMVMYDIDFVSLLLICGNK